MTAVSYAATSIKILAVAATLISAGAATSRPAEAGGRGVGFGIGLGVGIGAAGILANRIRERDQARRHEREVYVAPRRERAEPKYVSRSRDHDDDDVKRIVRKPAVVAKQSDDDKKPARKVDTTPPQKAPKAQNTDTAARRTPPPPPVVVAPAVNPASTVAPTDQASLPATTETVPPTDYAAPSSDFDVSQTVPPAVVLLPASSTVPAANECRRYLPSIGQTIIVPCG
jgi:hypothetical protein